MGHIFDDEHWRFIPPHVKDILKVLKLGSGMLCDSDEEDAPPVKPPLTEANWSSLSQTLLTADIAEMYSTSDLFDESEVNVLLELYGPTALAAHCNPGGRAIGVPNGFFKTESSFALRNQQRAFHTALRNVSQGAFHQSMVNYPDELFKRCKCIMSIFGLGLMGEGGCVYQDLPSLRRLVTELDTELESGYFGGIEIYPDGYYFLKLEREARHKRNILQAEEKASKGKGKSKSLSLDASNLRGEAAIDDDAWLMEYQQRYAECMVAAGWSKGMVEQCFTFATVFLSTDLGQVTKNVTAFKGKLENCQEKLAKNNLKREYDSTSMMGQEKDFEQEYTGQSTDDTGEKVKIPEADEDEVGEKRKREDAEKQEDV